MIAHQAEFRVSTSMCRVLRVSRSGFYAWLKESRDLGRDRDDPLLKAIRRIHLDSRGVYGYRRIIHVVTQSPALEH